ncbi:hypothetical protein ATANTOWER_031587 [Ataeniobius toweri]|uniref:Uncharacterized protein n=1 Tax=Ataeniobius toweri TaxID=208326 RepID=A0ABU7CE91_9TELE|nr:hypothetical protein [Ataeniobius toweri]
MFTYLDPLAKSIVIIPFLKDSKGFYCSDISVLNRIVLKMLWMQLLVQECLNPRNGAAEAHVMDTSVCSVGFSCSPHLLTLQQTLEWILLHNTLKALVIPCASFWPPFLPT